MNLKIKVFDKEYEKEFRKNKLIRHLILLHELNATQLGKDIFKHLADLNIDKGSEVLAADLATSLERYDFAIQISKKRHMKKDFTTNITIQSYRHLKV